MPIFPQPSSKILSLAYMDGGGRVAVMKTVDALNNQRMASTGGDRGTVMEKVQGR